MRPSSSVPFLPAPLKGLLFLLFALAGSPLAAAPALQVTTQTESPPETGEITVFTVHSPLGEYAFRPPKGWRLEVDAPARQLFLHSPDDTSHLEITFAPLNPALAPDAATNALREQVTARFPGAVILEEFSAYTAGLAGPGFDLRWQPAKGVTSAVRLAFVPRPAGTLEFRLTSCRISLPPSAPCLARCSPPSSNASRRRPSLRIARPPPPPSPSSAGKALPVTYPAIRHWCMGAVGGQRQLLLPRESRLPTLALGANDPIASLLFPHLRH